MRPEEKWPAIAFALAVTALIATVAFYGWLSHVEDMACIERTGMDCSGARWSARDEATR